MESPPACSTWSEAFPTSEDSGLLLTSGHSGSVSSGSCGGALALEEESDDEGKSLSAQESLSDGGGSEDGDDDEDDEEDEDDDENFNTLKKGPSWPAALAPPPEFQDRPPSVLLFPSVHKFASRLVVVLLEEALFIACKATWSIQCSQECHPDGFSSVVGEIVSSKGRWSGPRLCWTPELPPAPSNSNPARPGSHSSLFSSRLSSSHNSLALPIIHGDDSSAFITSAVSHNDISDLYNVPFDSDIYAVPVDVVRPQTCVPPPPVPPQRPRRHQHHHHHHHHHHHRKRRRHASSGSQSELERQAALHGRTVVNAARFACINGGGSKRHSVPSSISSSSGTRHICSTGSAESGGVIGCSEPVHMTLHEVRQYLQNLYSSSSDSVDNKTKTDVLPNVSCPKINRPLSINTDSAVKTSNSTAVNNGRKHKKSTFVINIKNKKAKELCSEVMTQKDNVEKEKVKKTTGRHSFSTNLKQTLCSIFRIRKPLSPDHHSMAVSVNCTVVASPEVENQAPKAPFLMRALPPLPAKSPEETIGCDATAEPAAPMPSPEDMPSANLEDTGETGGEEPSMDFAASIEKVKDYGWYWGPISGEAAEKVLSNEPDGSFIVRDSSDDHYIFSLTFKLNGCIRHVRIEHDQGNFSFGSCTKFKSHTIVDFIENAVEHSRSGRYLFFLHRRPVLGPMRVQLLHPVSRFKQVQSLQHMCRFVILKLVRRDLISVLPLPRRLLDYLSTPHYYAEQLLEEEQQRDFSTLGPSPSLSNVPSSAAFLPPIHHSHLP